MESDKTQPLRFPQEISDFIIDNLENEIQYLRSCALVNSRWLVRARNHIFNRVVIENDLPKVERLTSLLQESQHLCSLVRVLKLYFHTNSENPFDKRLEAHVCFLLERLDSIETLLVNVENARIKSAMRNAIFTSLCKTLSTSPVKTLQLRGWKFEGRMNLYRLFQAGQHLETVDLRPHACAFHAYHVGSMSIDNNISRLEIFDSSNYIRCFRFSSYLGDKRVLEWLLHPEFVAFLARLEDLACLTCDLRHPDTPNVDLAFAELVKAMLGPRLKRLSLTEPLHEALHKHSRLTYLEIQIGAGPADSVGWPRVVNTISSLKSFLEPYAFPNLETIALRIRGSEEPQPTKEDRIHWDALDIALGSNTGTVQTIFIHLSTVNDIIWEYHFRNLLPIAQSKELLKFCLGRKDPD